MWPFKKNPKLIAETGSIIDVMDTNVGNVRQQKNLAELDIKKLKRQIEEAKEGDNTKELRRQLREQIKYAAKCDKNIAKLLRREGKQEEKLAKEREAELAEEERREAA